MESNLPIPLIQLTEGDRKLVEDFADKVLVTDVYGFRNGQYDKERRKEQHIGSKLAELATFRYITSLGFECSEPDFTIHQRTKKSWEPDMRLKTGEPIHVKSQDTKSANKYGLSWIGEKSDKELYDKATGYVSLCLVDLNTSIVYIHGLPTAFFLKFNNLFSEPVLKKHRDKKFAIYFDHLKDYTFYQLWNLIAESQEPQIVNA